MRNVAITVATAAALIRRAASFHKLLSGCALALCIVLGLPAAGFADPVPQVIHTRIEAALQNIVTLQRPGQEGYATIWDGNKYVQCGLRPDGGMRCEAAGTLMQPSLEHVLAPERINRLLALGWRLDPSFGNFVQVFPRGAAVADAVLQVLVEGYDVESKALEVETNWIASEPCPPRNGPTQNLAGVINDAPSVAATTVHACSYTTGRGLGPNPSSVATDALIARYGLRTTGEIQRLRVNMGRSVYVVFDVEIGYIQCAPSNPTAIYCEAQSAESWAPIAGVLTPERLARLHAAGFTDPGRVPNYWKIYPADQFDDAAIAGELLTLLHDAYGYDGSWELKIKAQ